MSLAEVMPPYRDGSSQLSDRTPPQDMEAEQCVLGAMLMSKDAIADVVETIRGTDFYRPAHEQVYNAIIDLYGRGEPADAITVSDELGKRGELLRLGGAPYLHTLLASVPIAANAGWYAEIVREKAVLRRLADASVRIGQMSFAGEGDVDEIVDRAQAEVYAVTDRRAAEDFKPLSELMQPTLDEMEAIESRGAGLSGVPTGFADLDDLTNGLHPGQLVIVAARPGIGKALALDTPLPTPTGWTTMGEVEVGDELLGVGRPADPGRGGDQRDDRPPVLRGDVLRRHLGRRRRRAPVVGQRPGVPVGSGRAVVQVTAGTGNVPGPGHDEAGEAHGLPEPPSRQSVGFLHARGRLRPVRPGRHDRGDGPDRDGAGRPAQLGRGPHPAAPPSGGRAAAAAVRRRGRAGPLGGPPAGRLPEGLRAAAPRAAGRSARRGRADGCCRPRRDHRSRRRAGRRRPRAGAQPGLPRHLVPRGGRGMARSPTRSPGTPRAAAR